MNYKYSSVLKSGIQEPRPFGNALKRIQTQNLYWIRISSEKGSTMNLLQDYNTCLSSYFIAFDISHTTALSKLDLTISEEFCLGMADKMKCLKLLERRVLDSSYVTGRGSRHYTEKYTRSSTLHERNDDSRIWNICSVSNHFLGLFACNVSLFHFRLFSDPPTEYQFKVKTLKLDLVLKYRPETNFETMAWSSRYYKDRFSNRWP